MTHRAAYVARTATRRAPLQQRAVTRNTLRTRFLPGSFGVPSSALGTRGNRTTANTTQINIPGPYAPPTDTAQIKLVNGFLTWHFDVKFPRGVNVTATPQGYDSMTSGILYIVSVNPAGVTIGSTSATDQRIVHLMATGPT